MLVCTKAFGEHDGEFCRFDYNENHQCMLKAVYDRPKGENRQERMKLLNGQTPTPISCYNQGNFLKDNM